MDTKFPTFDVRVAYNGSGNAAPTTSGSIVSDANLTTDNFDFICPLMPEQLRYLTDPALIKPRPAINRPGYPAAPHQWS